MNGEYFKEWFESQSGDAFNFFDAFTGGSFTQMSIFALNITPYITSSIIMQLLTIAIPKLEELHRDGEEGRKKITEITRYLTIGLSIFESVAMAIGFGRQGLIPVMSAGSDASGFEKFAAAAVVVLCLTAGSAMLMWMGERITETVSYTHLSKERKCRDRWVTNRSLSRIWKLFVLTQKIIYC